MRIHIRRGDSPGSAGPRKGAWRREAVEFGALFLAAGLAHFFSTELGHRTAGSLMLVGLGGVLCVIVAGHLWWAHRHEHGPPRAPRRRGGRAAPLSAARLWRVRAQVRETPGQLAALTAAIAAVDGNIMSLSSQSDADGTVDELYVQLPAPVPAETLVKALTSAGGRAVSALPATVHELVDPITRTLLLASSVRAEPRRLPTALATMLDARLVPAGEGRHDGRETLSLATATGEAIRLHRPGLPFTASETARALAMLELAGHVTDPCRP
jgi:hypothetical protein